MTETITPQIVAEQYMTFNRGTGRTTMMVMSLPADEEVFIMVHHMSFSSYVKDLIAKHRPDININNISFISSANKSWRDPPLGKNQHIYIDHYVLDEWAVQQVTAINGIYGKRLAA
jgi:hypothetical protein